MSVYLGAVADAKTRFCRVFHVRRWPKKERKGGILELAVLSFFEESGRQYVTQDN